MTAKDVLGTTASSQVVITYDEPPQIASTGQPLVDWALARPTAHLAVKCLVDDPAGCVSLEVSAIAFSGPTNLTVANGVSAYEGHLVRLGVSGQAGGASSGGGVANYFADSSAKLVELATPGGEIIGFNAKSVSYGKGPDLAVARRASWTNRPSVNMVEPRWRHPPLWPK